MNPRIKIAFLEGLSKAKKCKNVLRRGDAFCASGILCHIHASEHDGTWKSDTYLNQAFRIPPQVEAWAGIVGKKLKWQGNLHTMEWISDRTDGFDTLAELVKEQW